LGNYVLIFFLCERAGPRFWKADVQSCRFSFPAADECFRPRFYVSKSSSPREAQDSFDRLHLPFSPRFFRPQLTLSNMTLNARICMRGPSSPFLVPYIFFHVRAHLPGFAPFVPTLLGTLETISLSLFSWGLRLTGTCLHDDLPPSSP